MNRWSSPRCCQTRPDEGEKKDTYLTLASLGVYLLIEQDAPVVTVIRRTQSGFVRELYTGVDAVIPLGEIESELPLAEIYAGVNLSPKPCVEEA